MLKNLQIWPENTKHVFKSQKMKNRQFQKISWKNWYLEIRKYIPAKAFTNIKQTMLLFTGKKVNPLILLFFRREMTALLLQHRTVFLKISGAVTRGSDISDISDINYSWYCKMFIQFWCNSMLTYPFFKHWQIHCNSYHTILP